MWDGAGNLFVADSENNRILKFALDAGAITTVVGSPGRMGVLLGPLPAGLGAPHGLAMGPGGDLLIADSMENAILAARF